MWLRRFPFRNHTATGVDEPKEAMLVFRVSYQTRTGPWQQTGRYRMLMFPGAQAPATANGNSK